MKLPKTLQICGLTYKIIPDNKLNGASFDCNKQEIRLGRSGSNEIRERYLLHEILEVIFVERECRFSPENGEEFDSYVLGYDHGNGICVRIDEHRAAGEGDKWVYTVVFDDGSEVMIFNPNMVFSKKED